MNPDCGSANNIPDNLKLLFRPVATTIPDAALIAEVSLYSMGFIHAKPLSRKIIQTLRLCSEQLSEQKHYEYGLRAVKAVLVTAAKFRETSPEASDNEYKVILKAMLDVNLPKFVSDDIPLFRGILKDMFPKVDPPEAAVGRQRLAEAVRDRCAENGLQATPWFMEKVLQLYEMVLVRHGIMLIGEPMSCKTVAYTILAEALTALAEEAEAGGEKGDAPVEYRTVYKVINPKSMTMAQLYGTFDSSTHEWTDGVLGRTFRCLLLQGI